MPRLLARLLGLGLCLALVGCWHKKCLVGHPHCPEPLPLVERSRIEPDLQHALSYAVLDQLLGEHRGCPGAYRGLCERDCQCRAAAASPKARIYELEQQAIESRIRSGPLAECQPRTRVARLQQAIEGYRAMEARNQAAARALELYYKLSEAEAKWDILVASLAQIEDTLAQSRSLMERGLRPPVEYEKLRRQRIDLQSDEVKLQLNLHQLNDELRKSLDLFDPCDPWRIWPLSDFQVVMECIDLEAAVAVGLQHRPELRLLRHLHCELDRVTLPVVSQVLGVRHGSPGMISAGALIPPRLRQLADCLCGDSPVVMARRLQLEEDLAERERAIANEVRHAVRTAEAEALQVSLARERVRSWQLQLDDLEARGAKGIASFAEISGARLEWLKARSDLVQAVMAWHTARASIKAAQGILHEECVPTWCQRNDSPQ